MTITKGFLTPVKSIKCDRCGAVEQFKRSYNSKNLCGDCFNIPPEKVRSADYIYSSNIMDYKERRIATLKCSMCGRVDKPNKIQNVCLECHTNHPDSTHDGLWGYKAEKDITRVSQCSYCGGVCVKYRLNTTKPDRLYFKVGTKSSSTESFTCDNDYEKVAKRQDVCVHEYVEVHSYVYSEVERNRRLRKIGPKADSLVDTINKMGGLDSDIEQQYLIEGATYFWCWKCGFKMHLNPSRYHLLRKKGR